MLEWRNKIEKDLSNVLQIENVFLNVSKGQVAPKSDLEKAFPKKTVEEIITDILENGELQVGEKERNAEHERTKNEVIDIVAGKLVDPKTKRVYTTGMIEKALGKRAGARRDLAGALSLNEHFSPLYAPRALTALHSLGGRS